MAKRQHSERDMSVPGGPRGLRCRGKGPTYYLKRQFKGTRYTISLGADLNRARARAQEILDSMARGDFSPEQLRDERVDILTALQEAAQRLAVQRDHSRKTRAAYSSRIDHFISFLADRHPKVHLLSDLPTGCGEQYVEWRRGQLVTRSGKARPETPRHPPNATTVHDDVRRLRALFNMVTWHNPLRQNPFTGVSVAVRLRDKSAAPRHLSTEQIRRLLCAAEKYDTAPRGPGAASTFRGKIRDMIAFYLLTGLRKEELIYLPWSNVDLDWGEFGQIEIVPVDEAVTLTVLPRSRKTEQLTELAASRTPKDLLFNNESQMRAFVRKNYADQESEALMATKAAAWDADAGLLRIRTRIRWKQKATRGSVPLVQESRAILERCRAERKESPFVFPHPDGGPLRSDPLPQFKKLLKEAKIPSSTRIHDLRHTFGFTLRDRDVPLETIMGLMRHANIEETMMYAKYTLKEGARRIQSLDGLVS